jgi:hypothetical protein
MESYCILFNVTFNNISVILRRSDLLVEETGEPGENLSQVTDKIDHISKVQSIKLFAPCPGSPVSSTNKSDRLNITEILLKVTLNKIN